MSHMRKCDPKPNRGVYPLNFDRIVLRVCGMTIKRSIKSQVIVQHSFNYIIM